MSSAGIVFAPYSTVTKAAVDSTGTVSVTCTGSGTESLSLNLIGGNTGACSPRQLRQGGASLGYQVYRDSARTSALCDGADRQDFTIDLRSGSPRTVDLTIYGRVLSNQNPSASGAYTDSLTVVIKKGGGVLATTTAAMNATVGSTCALSTTSLSFGIYDPAAGTVASATAAVSCTNGAPYTIGINGGQTPNGTNRRMAGSSGGHLTYEPFSDAARTAPWGDGTGLGSTVSGTGSGNAQNLIVYGRIPASQHTAPVGQYSDSVIVTVTY